LQRLGLDYVDIFYHHHYDPQTPLRQSPLCRDLLLLRPAHRRGRHHPPRARHPAADPPTVVLDAQPLDRKPPPRRSRH
jgi:hypothetical protein